MTAFTILQKMNSAGSYSFTGAVANRDIASFSCFTKDTKISLLKGTEKSFEELMEEGVDDFWVYSCDSKGNIVPGHAHSIRRTGENKPLVNITLDNDEEIKCRENHLFLMRDGSFKKALQLAIGDSLMPLYRKKSRSKNMPDYEIVYNPADNKWYYTHRRVSIEINGPYSPENVIHHSDFDKHNNSPENLMEMDWNLHTQLHNEQTSLLESYSKSERGRTKSRELMNRLWSDPEWRSNTVAKNKDIAEIGRMRNAINRCAKAPSIKQQILSAVRSRNLRTNTAIKTLSEYNNAVRSGSIEPTEKQISVRRQNAILLNQRRWNHKVIKVERIGAQDVYDITVDKYHNFALSAGIFVHNCLCGFDDSKKITNPLNGETTLP